MKKSILFCLLSLSCPVVGASVADSTRVIDEITVVGNRQAESLLHLPGSAAILSAAEIEFSNSQTTADALQSSGLLNVQKSQQGGGSPSIRGFEASRILLVVDGVRMNNLIYRAGHLQNIITVDPSALSRLEILYGPASVTYGSDALGGVIVMNTPNPVLADARTEAIRYGGNASASFNSVNDGTSIHADFNIAGSKFGSFTSLSFNRFGDLRSGRSSNPFLPEGDSYIYRRYDVFHSDGKDVLVENNKFWHQPGSGYLQYDLLQKLLWKPSEAYSHLLNFQLSNSNDVPRYDRLTDMKGSKPKFAQWYYGPQTRIMTSYTFSAVDRLGADRANLIVSYQNMKESRHNRKLDDLWLGSRCENVNVFSLNTDWIKHIGLHRLHAGLDGSLQFLRSTAYATDVNSGEQKSLDTRYPDGHNHLHNIDVFLSDTWSLLPTLTLTGGLRFGYSSLRSTFVSNEFYPFSSLIGTVRQDNPTYSVSVGAAYNPSPRWKLGLNVSTGYRVPNIDDLAKVFDSEPGTVVIPNPDVRPEQTLNADLNVATLGNEVVQWTASVFGTYMFDAVSLERTTFNGHDKIDYDGEPSWIYSNHNSSRAYVVGASTSLKVALGRNFGANANLTYTYGNYIEDDGMDIPLDHVAPLYGKIGCSFRSNNRKVHAELYSLFNARKAASRFNPNGEDNMGYATQYGMDGYADFQGMPAWFTLNLLASYNPTRNVTLQGGIENILDTEYRVFGSGINAPGRNFVATVRVSF